METPINAGHFCHVFGSPIHPVRIEYLQGCSVPPERFTCLEHASNAKRLGFFLQPSDLAEGESDTSNLFIVDAIYHPKADTDEDGEDDEGA